MAKSSASSKIKPVEQFVLAGICRRLEDGLDLGKGDVRVRTRDEAYDVFVGDKEKKPTFPFAFLMYSTVGDTNRYRPSVPNRGVYNPDALKPEDKEFAISIIPITMGMILEFYTDDYLKALKFISDTKFMQHNALLDFTLSYRGIDFTIEAQLGSDISVPLKSKTGPDVSSFVFNVDVVIHGFISSDGGKYDTKRKKGAKVVLTAQVDDADGETLFSQEKVIDPV